MKNAVVTVGIAPPVRFSERRQYGHGSHYLLLGGQKGGGVDDERDLDQLGGLKGEARAGNAQPAGGAIVGDPHHEGEQQQHYGEAEVAPRLVEITAIVYKVKKIYCSQTQKYEPHLSYEEMAGVAVELLVGHRGGGAVDHQYRKYAQDDYYHPQRLVAADELAIYALVSLFAFGAVHHSRSSILLFMRSILRTLSLNRRPLSS